MPGFNPERINIHELTVEEPEQQPELPFDVERDIPEEEWRNFEKILKRNGPWSEYCSLVADAKILRPDKNFFDQTKEETIKKKRDSTLRDFTHGFLWGSWVVNSKMLGLDLNVNQALVEKLRERARGDLIGSVESAADSALALKFLDPKFKLNEELRKELQRKFSEVREIEQWRDFARLAKFLKILDPQYDLQISSEEWKSMKDALNPRKQDSTIIFCDFPFQHAANMKILAAEKVEVTDKGLEITMPAKKIASDVPEMPETRSF